MPIIIPQDIPAYSTLSGENIFVMNSERAASQDIRYSLQRYSLLIGLNMQECPAEL